MRLGRFLACVAAMLATALTAHAQALKQPELLARQHQLIAGFDRPGFASFEKDYLAALGPDGDRCLFGCNSGFSGDSPDVSGNGYREFLAHADLATLARKLEHPTDALDHLEQASNLLQMFSESYTAAKVQERSGAPRGEYLWNTAWMDFSGCVGVMTPPVIHATALRAEVQQLKRRGGFSETDTERLTSIDQMLRKMTEEND